MRSSEGGRRAVGAACGVVVALAGGCGLGLGGLGAPVADAGGDDATMGDDDATEPAEAAAEAGPTDAAPDGPAATLVPSGATATGTGLAQQTHVLWATHSAR